MNDENKHNSSSLAPDLISFGAAFEKHSEADWRALVGKVLKDASFEKLVSATADGIAIQPLAHGPRSAPRPMRAHPGSWTVLARIDHADAVDANRQAQIDLAGGADGLHLPLAGGAGALGFGLAGTPARELPQALAGIDPAKCVVELDVAMPGAIAAATALGDWTIVSGLNPASARVSFGLDPLTAMMHVDAKDEWTTYLDGAIATARALSEKGFDGPFLTADARPVHAAGGSEVQELAFLLGAAASYFRAFENAGINPDRARRFIGFRIAADTDQFLTVAKLRALRRLMARIEEACGLDPDPIRVHAETAWRMMALSDPYVNVLRTTVAVFSAVTGGADAVTILPHTQAHGLPDADARRLARNCQLVLQEESHLGLVDDPAGGAGGIEDLTSALCTKAWALFQHHEAKGGIAAAVADGSFGTAVHAVREHRERLTASGLAPITGTSSYPDMNTAKPTVLAPLQPDWQHQFKPLLTPFRISEPFDALRKKAAELSAKGAEPKVFLATLGPLSAHNARANFVRNYLAAGGLGTVSSAELESTEDVAKAFPASRAAVACICSSDAVYSALASSCAAALKAAGAALVLIAQKPAKDANDLRAAGVDEFIFEGNDMIGLLDKLLAHM